MEIISSTIFVDEQKKTQITFVIRSDSVFVSLSLITIRPKIGTQSGRVSTWFYVNVNILMCVQGSIVVFLGVLPCYKR